jgi:hypothetical protein
MFDSDKIKIDKLDTNPDMRIKQKKKEKININDGEKSAIIITTFGGDKKFFVP